MTRARHAHRPNRGGRLLTYSLALLVTALFILAICY